MIKTVYLLLISTFLLWGGFRIVTSIQFDRNCGGYLKRAADANTVEIAKNELRYAISYAEKEQLTSGYTSVIWKTPNEDIGFWYNNLKASLGELEIINPAATQLEKVNVLMKLRETLLDSGEKSVIVTYPSGISVFPNNTAVAIIGVLSGIFTLMGIVLLVREYERYY